MKRELRRQWRNGRGGKWCCRIRWYEGVGVDDCADIRLQMEDCERKVNFYPNNQETADHVWSLFKQGAPEPKINEQLICSLVKLIATRYGRWSHISP